MTGPGNSILPHTGLCWYGIQKLPMLLDAFNSEIAGVKEATDSEYIHRMRVASRRLRAALPLFASCFPEKHYMKWMQELTRITRALGDARDADVQIAFLQKSLKRLQKEAAPEKGSTPGGKSPVEPALRFLLLGLQKKRGLLQKRVLSALAGLEKSRVTEEMERTFSTMNAGFAAQHRKPNLHGIPAVAALRIGKRLGRLLSYEPWVMHPEAVAEHHATRIAAKKLRYTMEIYGPVYRNSLKKHLARVKKIQEILGDIHDGDVWIDHITLLLLRERSLLRSSHKTKRPDTITIASLKEVLKERESERKRQYRQFVRYWHALERENLWDDLEKTLDSGRKVRYRLPSTPTDEEVLTAVHQLALVYPDGQNHSCHVTLLALMLFDGLQPLHNHGPRERFLLECAGLLHDIGWKFGQAGHNKRGAEMVISCEDLPFDLPDRGIIGQIILSHRGKVPRSSHPYFPLLSPVFQKKARELAAILRLADGLDFLHDDAVREVRCAIEPDRVICDVVGTGDLTREKERARSKADLFVQVFDRDLVIR
jgi:CHAD domain-containing protein